MPESQTSLMKQIDLERTFIHDLATPLMIAGGMTDSVLSKIEDSDPNRKRLASAFEAINKMTDLLRSRRTALVDQVEALKSTNDL